MRSIALFVGQRSMFRTAECQSIDIIEVTYILTGSVVPN